ncbi:MAG: hypothetical protein ACTHMC_16415 [Pseudobacter sp.]|uniref:hypothetical protein n=1 Tax=Pseudobacter sp. TaxID=2045420 RepID=UPI003F7DE41A
MKIYSFDLFLTEHAPGNYAEEYKTRRNEMLGKFPFSVLLDGAYFETDSLEKWINLHLGPGQINALFYIKTGYDFGFSEYFFQDEANAAAVRNAVPNIYTRHRHSDDPPDIISKSDGYESFVDYDPTNPNSIVIDVDDEY